MRLINNFKMEVKDFWRFLQIDIKDLPYQFNVLFPKVPKHTEEDKRKMERKLVLKYLHRQGEMVDDYITSEDVEKRKEELRGYKF